MTNNSTSLLVRVESEHPGLFSGERQDSSLSEPLSRPSRTGVISEFSPAIREWLDEQDYTFV
jgi:hypothetical protein